MLTDSTEHNHAHARLLVECLEHKPKLITLSHLDDVERRPIEDHICAFASGIDLDTKAVETC